MAKIVDLLRSGAIMGREFKIFEAHLPYVMKFFIDYNLCGMGQLKLSKASFRKIPFEIKKLMWNTELIEIKLEKRKRKYFTSQEHKENLNYR